MKANPTGSKGAVVITGASSGIGEACTLHLARQGFRVFAGVRREADGQRLVSTGLPSITPIQLDVTDASQIAQAAQTVKRETGRAGLAGLFNNAGIALGGPIEFIPLDELRRTMEVNYIGTIAVTQAFLPLIRQAQGRILINGSISGRVASPFIGAYSASKFALEALADVLRIELHPWNIRVVLIEAGNIYTPIWKKSLGVFEESILNYPPEAFHHYGWVLKPMLNRIAGMPAGEDPNLFARLVEHIFTTHQPKSRYLIGKGAYQRAIVRRLPDSVRDWLIWRLLPKDASQIDRS